VEGRKNFHAIKKSLHRETEQKRLESDPWKVSRHVTGRKARRERKKKGFSICTCRGSNTVLRMVREKSRSPCTLHGEIPRRRVKGEERPHNKKQPGLFPALPVSFWIGGVEKGRPTPRPTGDNFPHQPKNRKGFFKKKGESFRLQAVGSAHGDGRRNWLFHTNIGGLSALGRRSIVIRKMMRKARLRAS